LCRLMLNVFSLRKIFPLLFVIISLKGYAQKTLLNEDPSLLYTRAVELYEKAKYASAQKQFLLYADASKDRERKINAEYYAGVCAMELFNADAITLLNKIVITYPEHSKANLAQMQLGKFFYRSKDNKSAVKFFALVDAIELTPDEAEEFWFMKGYCLFKTDKYEDAKNAFKNCKDKPGKYFDPSNYYYGYVAYSENNYEEALEHFNRINKSKTFGPLAQVYISQILFARKRFAEVVAFADTISNKEIADDIAGIVGQSHFALENYSKSVTYLEKFNASSPVGRNHQDIYRLGFAYYKNGNYDKATEQFSQLADGKDTLSQFANYYLGCCFLQDTEKKNNARLAFEKAAALSFNNNITEASAFHFAKLSYDLGLQQPALQALADFINKYPESAYGDECKSLLSALLLSTRNYKDAIRLIESIKNLSTENATALQRVCYYRAEELYINNDYENATLFFKKSMQWQHDKKLFALAHFWCAELHYKKNEYEAASAIYRKFITFNETKDTRFYTLAYYNIGYSELKQEKYGEAVSSFQQFVQSEYARNNIEIFTDASMRIADCYFVLKEYLKAIDGYDVIIQKKLNGTDYALYQKAMIYGVLYKPSEKIAALELIKTNYPKSTYVDDAIYEIANVNLQIEAFDKAIQGFQLIIENYPRSLYIRKAYLNKGLAYYNSGRDENALAEFKILITQYSTSDEAREALVVIRNIFVNKGESDAYLEFIKVLPNVVISPTYQDSVSYESAFNLYKNGDCVKSARAFGNYINRFPGGFFILKANYYKAECDFKNKNFDSCLTNYEFVATYNRNDFTERSTRQCAILYFMQKRYAKAFEYYAALERIASSRDNLAVALLGQLKSSSLMNASMDTIAQTSFKYLNSGVSQKEGVIEARLNIARFFIKSMQPDSALPHFQYVLKETKNAMAAESKYNIAYIQYLKKENKACKKTIFELNDQYSDYELWTSRAFILLADVYTREKDYFQAKATLQSVIEGVSDETIKKDATEKLRQVIDQEEQGKPKPKVETEKEITPAN
jgi:TolA-binding protein